MSIIGGVLGGLGSLVGGLSQAKAASDQGDDLRNAQAEQFRQRGMDMLRNLAAIYGPERALQEFQTQFPEQYASTFGRAASPGMTPDQQAQLDGLIRERDALANSRGGSTPANSGGISRNLTGSPAANDNAARLRALDERIASLRAAGDPGVKGTMDLQAFKDANAGPTLMDQYRGLAGLASADGDRLLAGYDADFAKARGGVDSLLALAQQFGQGRMDQIDVDAGRALTGANRAAVAQASRGLGSGSIVGQIQRGNTTAVREQAQRQKNEINDQRIGQQLDLGKMGIGMDMNRANTRLGTSAALNDQANALRRLPIDTDLNVRMSPVANPGASINTAPFVNTANTGQVGTAVGGFLSGLGGDIYGNAQQNSANASATASLQALLASLAKK